MQTLLQGWAVSDLQSATKELIREWSLKREILFLSGYQNLERQESDDLPEGTRFVPSTNLAQGLMYPFKGKLEASVTFILQQVLVS